MNFPRREIVERIKKEYPEGTRVKLLHMRKRSLRKKQRT